MKLIFARDGNLDVTAVQPFAAAENLPRNGARFLLLEYHYVRIGNRHRITRILQVVGQNRRNQIRVFGNRNRFE